MKKIISTVAVLMLAACSGQQNASTTKNVPSADEQAVEQPSEISSEPVTGGPSNGRCSDASSELLYIIWHKQGGAAPGPGMIVGEQKLTYKGNVVGHTVTRVPGGATVEGEGHAWDISLTFISGEKKTLETTGNQQSGSETYAQKVEARMVRSLGPSIEHNRFFTYVICKNTWNFLIP